MDKKNRPVFPARAVITGGMPYGNKELHFGHIGAVFVHADIFARFLRDRIGDENVIFVSGTDCYGSLMEIGYQKALDSGFKGELIDYVRKNHEHQAETIRRYQVAPNLFGASALGEAGKVHAAFSAEVFNRLYDGGYLKLEKTKQFYDEEKGVFLNGRQVTGRCPIQGCKSETAYADECGLGHQYNPTELICPVSTLSGKTPVFRDVENWYFDLPAFAEKIHEALGEWEKDPACRKSLINVVTEFLKKPSVYVKKELLEQVAGIGEMPPYTVLEEEQKPSAELVFEDLDARDKAMTLLGGHSIRYRSGKAIVPFRLSGNVKWGIPVPEKEGASGMTFWVWPESLWAPISFTKAVLGESAEGHEWEKWWNDGDAKVYQFIGEDNIYFYAIAEMGLFEALGIKTPLIVPNRHLLYGKKKASSSSAVKPPMAAELLNFYTPEQLRMNFMNASLSERSSGFEPMALMGKVEGKFDTALYEGNLVTNVLNRLVRSCFYTMQKHCEGKYPAKAVSEAVIKSSEETILAYEDLMSRISLDKIFELLNIYLRDANKDWSVRSRSDDSEVIEQLIVDTFHVIRVSTALFHPIVPAGCDLVREYLGVDERIWDWKTIFEGLDYFFDENHAFKFLEPKFDFFKKHESQI